MIRKNQLSETRFELRGLWLNLWNSAILTSWGSIAIRTVGQAALLPLVLAKLPPQDVTVWLLFSSIMGLLMLADFGLSPTFIRAIAYTRATKSTSESGSPAVSKSVGIADIVRAMRHAYARLVCVVLVLATTVGTACLIIPIARMQNPPIGWLAWIAVLAGAMATVRNILYASILQGVNQIALLRRWETIVSLASLAGSAVALMFNLGLLGAVAVSQAGSIAGALVNRHLSRACTPAAAWSRECGESKRLPEEIWSSAWRSGLGVLMTLAVSQGSGIVYAQIAPPAQAASFLLAQRIMQIISSIAQVPFYTKIPVLAYLYADNKREQIVSVSRAGMRFSIWLLVISAVAGWLVLPPLLHHIGSTTQSPTDALWWSMTMALVLHRMGAMYLQTYSITNHIVWHVADGVSSLIILVASVPLYAAFGVIGLPLAWIVGYLFFYVPYSTYLSISAFPPKNVSREFCWNALPIVVVAAIFLYVL